MLSSGPLGQHLAIDFVADEGAEVRVIADGRIEHNYLKMGHYGGCDGTPGPVLITRYPGDTHGSYAVQYGHVLSALRDGELIMAGDVVGEVINYIPCCDTPKGCPHLHLPYGRRNTCSAGGVGSPRTGITV